MTKRINIKETDGTTPKGVNVQESTKPKKDLPDRIVTVVEGIHTGLTRNNTFYPPESLEKSTESWTREYGKPVIKNHDTWEEPTGRVIAANYKQSQVAPGKSTIELELEITDKDTIQKVLDGRYQTLSIGGSTRSVVCSVCGKDLVKEYCGHMKGRTYEGKQAYWIIGEMEFDEISWVNVPADRHAKVIHKNIADTKQTESVSTKGGTSVEDNILDTLDTLRTQEGASTEPEAPATEPETPETSVAEDTGTTPETPAADPETPAAEPTLQEQLDAANERIATLESENTTLTATNATLSEQVDTLTQEKQGLSEQVTVLDGENKALLKQSTTLATYTHKTLAESVANLQIVLGKVEESNKASVVADLTKQTSRSLQEQINGLVTETPVRVVQSVANPGMADRTNDDPTQAQQAEDKEVTWEDLAEKLGQVFVPKTN